MQTNDLDWSGYLTKKAYKTLLKQNWKRRFFNFDANNLLLKYSAAPGAAPKGEITLDPTDVFAIPVTDHGRPNEIKIESKGIPLFACGENPEDVQKLLVRIDAARRAKLLGDNGEKLIRIDSPEAASAKISLVSPGEPGVKIFTWGVGSVLGISKEKTQGISLPQRVREIQGPLQILAGPEHAAALTSQSTAYLWGSNEFSQLAVPASSFIVAFRPVILQQLSTKHVIGLACGGSHTLAVVAEGSGNSGTLFAWGTGSVGQLGLGGTVEITDTPSRVTLPSSPACGGKSPLQAVMPYAGIVSSAVVNTAGEVFVWGDASLGRLGLSTVYDSTPPGGVPVLVDASKEWTPKHLPFSLADLGPDAPRNATAPVVVSVAMGGSFSLFLLRPGNKAANIPGCTLLATGAIGIDITKDAYGTIDAATIEADLDREISAIPRRTTPGPIAPFGTQPVILSACAGARHAALVVAEISRGGVPRLYTAGKGWLGHSNDPISNLLPAPKTTTYFAPVSGVLAEEDVIEAACGHSHTIARTPDGRLFSWGRGDSGELGTGSLSDFNMPVPVSSLDGHVYKSVIAGSYYSAATAEPGYAGVRKSPTDVAAAIYATYAKVGGAAAAATGSSASTAKAAAPAPAPEPEENDDPDALPKGWDYDYDDEGNIYFIRPDGETQWEDPRDG